MVPNDGTRADRKIRHPAVRGARFALVFAVIVAVGAQIPTFARELLAGPVRVTEQGRSDFAVFALIGFSVWFVIAFVVATLWFMLRPDASQWLIAGVSLLIGVVIPFGVIAFLDLTPQEQIRTYCEDVSADGDACPIQLDRVEVQDGILMVPGLWEVETPAAEWCEPLSEAIDRSHPVWLVSSISRQVWRCSDQ